MRKMEPLYNNLGRSEEGLWRALDALLLCVALVAGFGLGGLSQAIASAGLALGSVVMVTAVAWLVQSVVAQRRALAAVHVFERIEALCNPAERLDALLQACGVRVAATRRGGVSVSRRASPHHVPGEPFVDLVDPGVRAAVVRRLGRVSFAGALLEAIQTVSCNGIYISARRWALLRGWDYRDVPPADLVRLIGGAGEPAQVDDRARAAFDWLRLNLAPEAGPAAEMLPETSVANGTMLGQLGQDAEADREYLMMMNVHFRADLSLEEALQVGILADLAELVTDRQGRVTASGRPSSDPSQRTVWPHQFTGTVGRLRRA